MLLNSTEEIEMKSCRGMFSVLVFYLSLRTVLMMQRRIYNVFQMSGSMNAEICVQKEQTKKRKRKR